MTFQTVLLKRGVKFRTGGDREKILLCCPFCVERGKSADSQFRLAVHARQGWGRCMHCDWKRKFAVAAVLRKLDVEDEVEGFEREEKAEAPPVELPKDFTLLSSPADDLDEQARNYVLQRGVTKEQIKACKIGVSYTGRYAYRIIFPVYAGGRLRGINSRSFVKSKGPKYLTNVGEKWLYNFDPTKKVVVLSEGSFKALRIERACGCGSAALLGHDLTETQEKQLVESAVEEIVLYPDLEHAGRMGFIKLADKLAERWRVRFAHLVTLPADEAPLKDLQRLINDAVTYSWIVRQKVLLQVP